MPLEAIRPRKCPKAPTFRPASLPCPNVVATFRSRRLPRPNAAATFRSRRLPRPNAAATFRSRRLPSPNAAATFRSRRFPRPNAAATFRSGRLPRPNAAATFRSWRLPCLILPVSKSPRLDKSLLSRRPLRGVVFLGKETASAHASKTRLVGVRLLNYRENTKPALFWEAGFLLTLRRPRRGTCQVPQGGTWQVPLLARHDRSRAGGPKRESHAPAKSPSCSAR